MASECVPIRRNHKKLKLYQKQLKIICYIGICPFYVQILKKKTKQNKTDKFHIKMGIKLDKIQIQNIFNKLKILCNFLIF